MVLDGLLVERNVAAEVDDGGYGPAPFFVRHAHHQCVIDGGIGLENFLNFLGVNLLASCINAHAATAQQSQAAIGLDRAPVARNRIADPIDGAEGLGGFLGILVISRRNRTHEGDKSRYAASWRHFPVVFRSEEHTSELQSLMRISYAVFCLKKKNQTRTDT